MQYCLLIWVGIICFIFVCFYSFPRKNITNYDGQHFRNTIPLLWWKSQLLTANAATAALERHFSSFGSEIDWVVKKHPHFFVQIHESRKPNKRVQFGLYLGDEHYISVTDSSDDEPLIGLKNKNWFILNFHIYCFKLHFRTNLFKLYMLITFWNFHFVFSEVPDMFLLGSIY